MKLFGAFVAVWMLVGILGSGFLHAYFREVYWRQELSAEQAKKDQLADLTIGAIGGPLIVALSPVLTEGFRYGWSLSAEPMPCRVESEAAQRRKEWCGS